MNKQVACGYYRHFKGNYYEVIDTAKHSETLEPMVVYRALYGEQGMWVRPLSMWHEIVEHEGVLVARFTFVGGRLSSEVQRKASSRRFPIQTFARAIVEKILDVRNIFISDWW